MIEEFITPVHKQETLPPEVIAPASHSNGKPFSEKPLSETPRQLHVEAEINNTNKNFKGQYKNETVLCFCRKHWIVLFPTLLGLVIFGVLVLSYFIFISSADLRSLMAPITYQTFALFGLAAATFYLHRVFNIIFNYYLQTLIVTNFRVIHNEQTLFFSRNKDSVDLREIQDIVVHQKGIMQTILNYGNIIITMSSAHASKVYRRIPNPDYHFKKINKTKREYITGRKEEKAK